MTPAFKNYILDLIKTAARDYGLTAGPEVTYADYNRAYIDGKTQEEYWREVVEKRLLKVAPLYEGAWDPDTQTLKPDTDFRKYLIAPSESTGFPQEWSSGYRAEKNQAAFSMANTFIREGDSRKVTTSGLTPKPTRELIEIVRRMMKTPKDFSDYHGKVIPLLKALSDENIPLSRTRKPILSDASDWTELKPLTKSYRLRIQTLKRALYPRKKSLIFRTQALS